MKSETMSEQEQFEIQGRAYADLKKAQGKAATIRVGLTEHGRTFVELGHLLEQFVRNPNHVNPNYVSLAGHLKESVAQVNGDSIVKLIDELQAELARIAELQSQIEKF